MFPYSQLLMLYFNEKYSKYLKHQITQVYITWKAWPCFQLHTVLFLPDKKYTITTQEIVKNLTFPNTGLPRYPNHIRQTA